MTDRITADILVEAFDLPMPDFNALKARIEEAAAAHKATMTVDGRRYPADRAAETIDWKAKYEIEHARHVAVVKALLADRAGILRGAADEIDRETQQLKADGVLGPDEFRPCRDVTAELRRKADEAQQAGNRDCPACDAGIDHDVHCPTPESHNAGCGCPGDQPAN